MTVDNLVSALRNHLSNADVVERACGALHNLAVSLDVQGRIVDVDGGLAAIVVAMSTHQSVVNIQERCCGLLIYLASHDAQAKAAVGATPGAITAITMAILAHARIIDVCDRACELLWVLSFDDGDNKARIVAAPTGIGALVRAMTSNADTASVQEHAAACLWNLALEPSLRPRLRRAVDVQRALKAAITNHGGVTAVQDNARGCLQELARTGGDGEAGTPARGAVTSHYGGATSAGDVDEGKYGEWSGWVHKKSDWLRVWRRRYCVVRTDFIVFAVDEEVRCVYGYDVLAVSVWL